MPMKRIFLIYLFALFWIGSEAQRTSLDDHVQLFRFFRKFGRDLVGKTTVPGSRNFNDARNNRQVQEPISLDTPFPCNLTNVRSPEPPRSIDKLRPGDVDIIAAIGDSLTAGVGATATNLLHLAVENRGVSWSGGGQGTWREFLTLPNILKVFNPNLYGFAESDALIIEKESRFNVGASLGQSRDIPFSAEILVKRMKSDPKVDIEKHWKLITMMIGGNDFCSEICYHSDLKLLLEEHRNDMISTLRILRDNLPRTFVAFVNGPQLREMVNFNARDFLCMMSAHTECSCLFGYRWRHRREEFYDFMDKWADIEDEIPLMPEFQREDFTVVTQPYARNVSIPRVSSGKSDRTYLSADCFHLTQKAYARAATAIWNNLLEPVGQKTPRWVGINEKFLCPTEQRPYIATYGNS